SKGLMYNYFKSKEELMQAIMESAFVIGEEMMAGMQHAITPQDKIRFIIESSFTWATEHADYSKTMMQLALQVGKFPMVQKMVDAKIEGFKTIFVHLFEELGFENPEMEAYCLGALFDGIGMQFASVGDKIGYERVKEFLIDKYCNKTLKNEN
ncbi:MAG: hypothetical protein KDC92_11095, partial [Bacteroidetes bacterium]|nr:hypothetical protein [Bacteroidota bacterium]